MDNSLIIGWALNAIWLFHIVFKNKSGRRYKIIAILLLTVPYLGFIFYFIFYVWDVPPLQPLFMRQNVPDHYGNTTFGKAPYRSVAPRRTRRKLRRAERVKGIEDIPRLVKKKIWLRVGFLLLGLTIILLGLKGTLGVDGSYRNWWGGLVFGPAAIFIGVLFIYVMARKPRKKSDNERIE